MKHIKQKTHNKNHVENTHAEWQMLIYLQRKLADQPVQKDTEVEIWKKNQKVINGILYPKKMQSTFHVWILDCKGSLYKEPISYSPHLVTVT